MLLLQSNKSKIYHEEYLHYAAFSSSAKRTFWNCAGVTSVFEDTARILVMLVTVHAANCWQRVTLFIIPLFKMCVYLAFCTFRLKIHLVNNLWSIRGFLPPLLSGTSCCMSAIWLVETRSKAQCLVGIAVQRFERPKIHVHMRFTSWHWNGHLYSPKNSLKLTEFIRTRICLIWRTLVSEMLF